MELISYELEIFFLLTLQFNNLYFIIPKKNRCSGDSSQSRDHNAAPHFFPS